MNELAKILKRLSTFEDKNDRSEFLIINGIKPNELDNQASRLFNRGKAQIKLIEGRDRKENFAKALTLLKRKIKDFGVKGLTDSLSLKGIEVFSYHFSKLSEVTEEDLLGMMNDEQLLEIIQELEK